MATESQQQAIEQFRAFLEYDCKDGRSDITTWELTTTEYGQIWINAKVDYNDKVSPDSLLRWLDHRSWFVLVGKHGALTVKMCPKAFEQFHGKRAFRMNFDLTSRSQS